MGAVKNFAWCLGTCERERREALPAKLPQPIAIIPLTSPYYYSNLSTNRQSYKKPFGYSPQKGFQEQAGFSYGGGGEGVWRDNALPDALFQPAGGRDSFCYALALAGRRAYHSKNYQQINRGRSPKGHPPCEFLVY